MRKNSMKPTPAEAEVLAAFKVRAAADGVLRWDDFAAVVEERGMHPITVTAHAVSLAEKGHLEHIDGGDASAGAYRLAARPRLSSLGVIVFDESEEGVGQVRAFIAQAAPGRTLHYHTGSLATACYGAGRGSLLWRVRELLNAAEREGRIYLVQRRTGRKDDAGSGMFEYLAIKAG